MKVITAAAYISHGLASEMGKLPPCMLPVQNRRLYEHQHGLFQNVPGNETYISLPMNFMIPKYDEIFMSRIGLIPVRVPEGLSLGQSMVYVLNYVGHYDEPLYVLHGDTLFLELTGEEDVFSTAQADDYYDWDSVDDKNVYSGFFSFGKQSLLIQKIVENNYDFIKGVEAYGDVCPMKPVKLAGWLDFGLVNSYYRSISKMTTERAFNSMQVTRYSVRKSSVNHQKMQAEALWIANMPDAMKHYVPSIYAKGDDFYEIEYFFLPSLANLFVFGRNSIQTWKDIIGACIEYINDEARFKPKNTKEIAVANDKLYGQKTRQRLLDYSHQSGISLEHNWIINGEIVPSLLEVADEMDSLISKSDERFVAIMHGDTCFSNILYDFKSKTIKVIDPRGIDSDGHFSIYGDLRYDVAKLSHSIIGLYDFIVGGRYTLNRLGDYNINISFETDEVVRQLRSWFLKQKFFGLTIAELCAYPIMVHLFLSMLPLHSDCPERQVAFLANALRLYCEMK